jgi:polyhydroxybutyrate depolymerase
MKKYLAYLFVASTLVACGDDSPAADDDAVPDAGPAAPDANPLVEARPYGLHVPDSYDAATPTPLVILLHGYSASGAIQAAYFGLTPDSDEHGYLLAYPDGLVDSDGKPFWNATDGCCNFDNNPVDDVAYLSAVIDDIEVRYNIDPKRVYVIGHSNGGFMAHRLACEIGDRIAAIVSLAGMVWKDPSKCPAAAKVNVLQVHGTADDTIYYDGNQYYPSAAQTVATWAAKNGCTGELGEGDAPLDLDTSVAGAETTRQHWNGCPEGGAVDFWTMEGGSHIPSFNDTWGDQVWAYFDSHRKP